MSEKKVKQLRKRIEGMKLITEDANRLYKLYKRVRQGMTDSVMIPKNQPIWPSRRRSGEIMTDYRVRRKDERRRQISRIQDALREVQGT